MLGESLMPMEGFSKARLVALLNKCRSYNKDWQCFTAYVLRPQISPTDVSNRCQK
jgi:hypothetical protein